MSRFLERMMSLGTSAEFPDYLNTKLRITNVIAYSLLFIAISYTVLSLVFYPPLAWLPAMGIPVIILSLFLGYQGAYHLYRLLIVLVPVGITFTYHEGLLTAGDTPLGSTVLLQGAFSLLPFIVFDHRDKVCLGVAATISFLAMVFFNSAEGWLEYGLDDSLFRTGIMHELTVAVAMLLLYLSVYTLSTMNARAEKRSQLLVEQGEQQNEELNRQREKMEKSLKALEGSQQEERRRAWASEGFSQFATVMRQSTNTQQMYDELVASLVKYVQANQAGLFIVEGDEENKYLQLQACYAYGRKKHKEQRIQPGQGLVGQAYLEKDYVYRTDIPQGYTYITSGLGEATPAALLIIPLISNNIVEGVLEVAAFKPFEKHVIEFLMNLGEDIAATVGVSRINELTRKLLTEAQEQAEAMRAQEEELRQNMEELSATQEEMRRKEKGYLEEIEHLKSIVSANQ